MSCNLFVPGSVSVSNDTQKISSCLQVTLGYIPSKKYFCKTSNSGLPKDLNLKFLPGYLFASQTKYQLPGLKKLLTRHPVLAGNKVHFIYSVVGITQSCNTAPRHSKGQVTHSIAPTISKTIFTFFQGYKYISS